MTVSFQRLWGYALGWLAGDFLWHPIMGGDLMSDLRETCAVMVFIAMAWCFEKGLRAMSPAKEDVGESAS